MNKAFVGVIVATLVVLVGGGAFVAAPYLQSSQAKVSARSGVHTERARRLLRRFNQNRERTGVLADALAPSGVGDDGYVKALLETESNRDVVDAADGRLQKRLSAKELRDFRDIDDRYYQAKFGTDWQTQAPAPKRMRIGGNETQMRNSLIEGLRKREELVAENEALLRDALAAVDQALAEAEGEASGRDDVHANRLKGIILYHMGQAAERAAHQRRFEAGTFRAELAALGHQATGVLDIRDTVASSDVVNQVEVARRGVVEAEAALTETRAAAAAIEAEADDLRQRIEEAATVAEQARAEMESMETQGVDLTDSQGYEKFAAEFNGLANTYRKAIGEARALEFGQLLNAQIDSSGDLVAGEYVAVDSGKPIEVSGGLAGVMVRLSDAQLVLAAAERSLADAQGAVESAEARKAAYEERASRAVAEVAEFSTAATAAYAEFLRHSEQADASEAKAVEDYRNAIRSLDSAARLAKQRSLDADGAVSTLPLEAQERSPERLMADDVWLEQQFKVNAADVRIALGRLYYVASEDAQMSADVISALPKEVAPADAMADTWLTRANDARESGIEELYTAYDALQQTTGKLRNQWTVAAEAAAAANLLALLGEEGLLEITIATYDQIVGDQPDEPRMRSYADRLELLRSAE